MGTGTGLFGRVTVRTVGARLECARRSSRRPVVGVGMRAFGIHFPRALRRPFLTGRVSFLKARAVDASICPGRCFSVTLFMRTAANNNTRITLAAFVVVCCVFYCTSLCLNKVCFLCNVSRFAFHLDTTCDV